MSFRNNIRTIFNQADFSKNCNGKRNGFRMSVYTTFLNCQFICPDSLVV